MNEDMFTLNDERTIQEMLDDYDKLKEEVALLPSDVPKEELTEKQSQLLDDYEQNCDFLNHARNALDFTRASTVNIVTGDAREGNTQVQSLYKDADEYSEAVTTLTAGFDDRLSEAMESTRETPVYKELNRDAAEDLLRDSSLELTDAGKKLFPDIPVNSDKGTVLTFPEESLKDEEPIDFSSVEMERFSETEKGSYLLMPTAELLDQILDRMSTVNVVVSKKEATLPMPKREELDESECILYVDTNEEQTAADLHFADPKSGFQTAVPLLQPEEATLIAIANNLEKQIENFEKAIDVVADAINTHATEQDAIEKA